MRAVHVSVLLTWLLLTSPAAAVTVYRCVDAQGHVSYQDAPCKNDERQSIRHVTAIATPAPAASIGTSAMPTPVRAASPPPAPPPSPPVARTPPPLLFRCVNAVNGQVYLSRSGRPRAYLAPLAMLGAIDVPLGIAYGSAQGAGVGMSAPELMPNPTPAMIGSGYVWVHDRCQRLPPAAACAALRKRLAANRRATHDAFPDERAPLLAHRAQLRAQLAGCRR